jgi:DNA-binding response OmpR family regulator
MSRILLVDDDDLFRKMLRKTLEKMGHIIFEAGDGDEALRMCRLKNPDLVLTDLVMPEKEGLETIVEMKKEFPGLPVIAMSGGGRNRPDIYLAMASRLGADCVLGKPFSSQILSDAIKAALGSTPGSFQWRYPCLPSRFLSGLQSRLTISA